MVSNKSVIHVDMDAFYASVEIRDRPELEGLPVVVGGDPDQRGVIAAASYAARKFGVHSAMPSKTAARLCPDLVFIKARHAHYAKVSRQMRRIFERYTPLIEPLSLDEAFLDVTASQRLWGTPESIGRRLKSEIKDELDLTASVGIAPTKFMAKLASDLEKPDGFVVVAPSAVQSVLDPLPVARIWGVGRAGERQLHALGVRTIGQLRRQSPELLKRTFGAWGDHIWKLAHGEDRREVITDGEAKSISHETTFHEDIDDKDVLSAVLLDLTEQVAIRLRRQELQGQTLQIKVRFGDFSTITRAQSMVTATSITREMWQVARALLSKVIEARDEPIRLLGVGVTGLQQPAAEQADLFNRSRETQRKLDRVADQVNRKFGTRALHRGLKED